MSKSTRENALGKSIAPADGKLLVLTPGLGAVSTTFMAGVELARKGLAKPIGSLTQLAPIPGTNTPMKDALPLATLDQLAFAAWDMHGEDGLTVARRSDVLSAQHVHQTERLLSSVQPMAAVHDPATVRRLEPKKVKEQKKKRDLALALQQDIRDAKQKAGATRAVAICVTSTEVAQQPSAAHASLQAFEQGLDRDDAAITPTQLYAYACMRERVPFANGTPNLVLDLPAFHELAREMQVPMAGKDLKTGQTMIKTALAPALKSRMLGLAGWFSTNILGNRDGEVLDDRDAFKSKETTKRGVLDTILEPEKYPDLYGKIHHKVEINYYPPRGDNKEGWDNIDIVGWAGYPMQIKVNFLCRDSILAAPLLLDLALLMDVAQRAGERGYADWLGFYFKAPMTGSSGVVTHDLFAQQARLGEALSALAARVG
jgi:myo-inositol-1-phosphate synthase